MGQAWSHPPRRNAHGLAEARGKKLRFVFLLQLCAEQSLDKQPLDGDGLGVDDLLLNFEGSSYRRTSTAAT